MPHPDPRPDPPDQGDDQAPEQGPVAQASSPGGAHDPLEAAPGAGPSQREELERTLMAAVVAGADRLALRALVEFLGPRLYAAARALVAAPYVDDLVQLTLVRVWQYRASYRGDAAPMTWITAIMRNVATDPKLRSRETAFGLDLGTVAVDHVDDIEAFLQAHRVQEALAKLTPRERELIVRRHVQEQTWEAIGAEMGFRSVYFVHKAYAAAKASLAKHLNISPSS